MSEGLRPLAIAPTTRPLNIFDIWADIERIVDPSPEDIFSNNDAYFDEDEYIGQGELGWPLEEVYFDEVNIGDGLIGHEYEGNDDSYVPVSDFFNKDGTLNQQHKALYFTQYNEDAILRVEQDGSWTSVDSPSPYDDEANLARRGRVQKSDLSNMILDYKGEPSEAVIFFGEGFGPLSQIESIISVPSYVQTVSTKLLEWTKVNDIMQQFEKNLSSAVVNPEE